ncbi:MULTISPECIES: GNAT family N-acetyltransferase [unclassified Brenneria]|uniref:GNAT family N-acetyltransferase n=1 Tax=unclassified Brenneria TaxID=2634434 RepID=UPI0029C4D869|nr:MULTISPECIES: GNAT family N-acetyltransferase [unclassified Brenneria]MDX5626730.1 GNAT family N-acetyltransferase [Brenneria sp. L3-3Z]MDX5693920.1 GNAT family N-acetyltransferase [Brenneria sp. L4-2C]
MFLSEQDILLLRPHILHDYLPSLALRACCDRHGRPQGFIGTLDNKIEMLFVAPECRGMGIGSTLLNYAVNTVKATRVDVNEQNPQAKGFYEHHGFRVIGRSEQDGLGNNFPLLHMSRK